ncbi:MAG: ISAs1 family transposase, partial [Moorea sp. SIO2I5]|nr:ISAs1 family transposase [Moorena sp. SIO2I5]
MARTRPHNLVDLVTVSLLAVLCGADGCVAIETYGLALPSWLERFLELPNGIPSHDTIGRVLGLLDPLDLEKGFLSWVAELTQRLGLQLRPIDGKTKRGSYDRKGKLKALHSVSAISSEHGLVVAQQKVDHKSNEISAVPKLLKLLNLKRTVVT